MKTLVEHNTQRMESYCDMLTLSAPHLNGIACPTCGIELWDSEPRIMLASYPPKKNVHCSNCGYYGYRVV